MRSLLNSQYLTPKQILPQEKNHLNYFITVHQDHLSRSLLWVIYQDHLRIFSRQILYLYIFTKIDKHLVCGSEASSIPSKFS